MGKKATKAADNMYYLARCEAAETNADFSSREKAAELVGIDRTRLARIELDTIVPYPEEVKAMAKAYNTPELNNSFCARECPLGRSSVSEVDIVDFDRLAFPGEDQYQCQSFEIMGHQKYTHQGGGRLILPLFILFYSAYLAVAFSANSVVTSAS